MPDPLGPIGLITLLDKILPVLVMVPLLVNVIVALICSVCPDLIVNDDPYGKLKLAVISIILLSGL